MKHLPCTPEQLEQLRSIMTEVDFVAMNLKFLRDQQWVPWEKNTQVQKDDIIVIPKTWVTLKIV